MYCPNCNKHFESGRFCPDCEGPNGEAIRLIEDPALSGVSLGDANAISGGLHVNDSHAVHNEDKSVHNITNNSSNTTNTVNNKTVYEAQKSQAELIQDNENLFMQAVQERFSDGLLDQMELAELYQLRLKWQIPVERANLIIDQVRKSMSVLQGSQGSEYLTQQILDEVYNAVNHNQVDILRRRLPTLKRIAQTSLDANIQFYYHMLLASLTPEVCAIDFLNARTDNYWQLFWVHVAYVKLGNIDNASVLLARLGGFGAPQGDMALLMAIDNLAEYRKNNNQDYFLSQTQQYLDQATQLGISDPLTSLWYATKEAMQEEQKPEEWYQFYCTYTVKELCPVKAPAMPKSPPEMPQMQVPPVPKFNAQSVNLAQMQGFNPLQASQQMGLGLAGTMKQMNMGMVTPPPMPTASPAMPVAPDIKANASSEQIAKEGRQTDEAID